MDRERFDAPSEEELEDLRSEIEQQLAHRAGGREVLEERSTEHGTLRREVSTGADGRAEPEWYLYYYADTKTGKRRLISEKLGPELPPEYRE